MLDTLQLEVLAEVLNRAPATKAELYVIREVFTELQRQIDEAQPQPQAQDENADEAASE